MKKVSVHLGKRSYSIIIQQDLLYNIENYIDINQEFVIFSDDFIPKEHINKIIPKLNPKIVEFIPHGEHSKSMEMAYSLINLMISKGVTRGATIIAFGGGVIGDLAGFIASVYMRGLDYIQIPTTLLSMVDSSVGGKVGINADNMKNAIGSFKQPKVVLIDPNTLKTLDEKQFNNGVAEVIKYGLIAGKSLYEDLLVNNIHDRIDDYIYECVKIKADIVSKDELDLGVRQILNYGHTLGHALEQASNYKLLHGEAVSIGMLFMAKNKPFENSLSSLLKKYNLPTSYEYNKEQILRLIATDKKATQNKLNIIMVDTVGKGYVEPTTINYFIEKL